MKKQILTLAIVLGLATASFAQGGLFRRGDDAGNSPDAGYALSNTKEGGDATVGAPLLPLHNSSDNGNQPAPLGSGIAVLVGLGAAYLVGKRREE